MFSFIFLTYTLSKRQALDAEKRAACERAGISLVEVPYWWDYKKESLAGSILSVAPNIFLYYFYHLLFIII